MTKQPKKFSFSPTSSSSAMRMTGQYCLPFEDTYGARNLNWPPFREDYRYGFRVWCRGYSDSSEDEDFTFKVSPKETLGESSSQTIDSWRNKDQASSVPLGQPETEGFRSHPSRPSSPLSRAQKIKSTSEEGERGQSPFSRQEGEAPGTSEAKSQNPFSDSQMKELLERLNRHSPPRQVGDNQPPIPNPTEIKSPVPEQSKNWWNSLLCLCRGSQAKESTPSGNEGNGEDIGSGDPGE